MWKILALCIIGVALVSFADAKNGKENNKSGKRKELKIEVLKEVECSEEEKAKVGHVVQFHYKMSVVGHPDITDSTYGVEDNQGVVYLLSKGLSLKGLLKGIPGMCRGEIRKLTIPPHLAYGSKGHESVPGGATLIYEVELLNFKEADEVIQKFLKADINGDGVLDMQEMEDIFTAALRNSNTPITDEPGFKEAMLHQLFVHADKNKDGGISTEEFSALLNLTNGKKQKKPKQEL